MTGLSDRREPVGRDEPIDPRESAGEEAKVLFVMGYGRSGSTFLDILLNNASAVTSVGALGHYWTWLGERRPCACGRSLPECPLWGEVSETHLGRLSHGDLERWNAVQEDVEGRSRLVRLLTGRLPEELLGRYREAVGTLLDTLDELTPGAAIVDSSGSGARSTGRAYALARHTDADVRVIHLVRDGRAVTWSSLKGPGSPERPTVGLPRPLRAVRAGAAWSLTNLLCEWIARKLAPDRVLRLRYEDLATDTSAALRTLASFGGLDLDDLIEKVEADAPLEVGHNVAGNRLRFRDRIRIRPDFSWRNGMSRPYRWALTAQLWPLLLRYGYLRDSVPRTPDARPTEPEDSTSG